MKNFKIFNVWNIAILLAFLLFSAEPIQAEQFSFVRIFKWLRTNTFTVDDSATVVRHLKVGAKINAGSLTIDTNVSIGGNLSVVGSVKKTGADTAASYTVGTFTTGTIAVIDSALTGYASPPTDTLRCSVGFFHVDCLQVAGLSGTSNGTALTVGHIPAAFRPSHTVTVTISKVTDNGGPRQSIGSLATTGIITVSKTDSMGVQSATFTASGTKGVGAGVIYSFPRF